MNEKVIFDGRATGVTFDPAKKNIKKLWFGGVEEPKLSLAHIPDNPYDKNAIRVMTTVGKRDLELGWVPKKVNEEVLSYGLSNVCCLFAGYTIYEEEAVGISILIIYSE